MKEGSLHQLLLWAVFTWKHGQMSANYVKNGVISLLYCYRDQFCRVFLANDFFLGTEFPKCSIKSAVTVGAAILWSFLIFHVTILWDLSPSYGFLLGSCFDGEVFPYDSKDLIIFETVPYNTLNISAIYVMLAPAVRASTMWLLWNSYRAVILMNFNYFFSDAIRKETAFVAKYIMLQ